MDPNLILAGASVLGRGLQTVPAGPSSAVNAGQFSYPFDNSGWNVNFGSGTITSDRTQEAASPSGEVMKWIPIAAAAVGVVLLWKLVKR